MSSIVLPGDKIYVDEKNQVTSGPGIYCDPKTQDLRIVNAGIKVVNETKKGELIYIDYDCRRYIPCVGDFVIGTITALFSDSYRVTLANFCSPVILMYMGFPNATKKNKPTLKVGDLCYARVRSSECDVEAELECMDSRTGKDCGFGGLDGGMVIDVPLAFSRELLFNNEYELLPLLSRYTQFEVAIGVNGKVWIKTEEVRTTLACYKSISSCSTRRRGEFKRIIREHFKQLTSIVE